MLYSILAVTHEGIEYYFASGSACNGNVVPHRHKVIPVLKYVVAWLPMVLIAIANGSLRQFWYGHYVGELHAHQISTLTAVMFFSGYIWAVLKFWPLPSAAQSMRVGGIWLLLTVCFEFLFGHFIAGHTWSRLLQDYNLFAGCVWLVIPIWIALAPYVVYRCQQRYHFTRNAS